MPKRGHDDDYEMPDERGGKSFRDDGGQRRYSGEGGEPRNRGHGNNPHRAYFERHKHEEWMLRAYDPKSIERTLKKRAFEAQQAAERFASHCQGHALEGAHQVFEELGRSAMETEDGKRKPGASFAPPLFWERVDRDLETAVRLQHKLDGEKGLSSEAVDAVVAGLSSGDGEEVADGDKVKTGQLDTVLEYLWHVHGVNYYAGTELLWKDYHLRLERPRMIRRVAGLPSVTKPAFPPTAEAEQGVQEAAAATNGSNGEAAVAMEDAKNEDGGEAAGQKATEEAGAGDVMDVEGAKKEGEEGNLTTPPSKRAAKRMARIDSVWEARLSEGKGDPSEKFLGKERVQKMLEEFIESQLEKMGEEKFGCKLCTKLFRSEDFVRRHIHNKHKSMVEEVEEKAYEEVYAQNYVEEKEQEDRRRGHDRPRGGPGGRPGFGGPMVGGRFPMGGRGGFPMGGRGGFPSPMMAGGFGGRGPMMPHPGATMQAPRQAYNDLDAPKETRTVLDYGDL